jgi:glycosyltransferase involved in cell wall biosynthesis
MELVNQWPKIVLTGGSGFLGSHLLNNEAFQEALAIGRTQPRNHRHFQIVSFDGEGASVLNRSKSAFVCRAGNSNELAEAIEKVCNSNQGELDELGLSARRYAEGNFRAERVMATLFEVCGLR